MSRPFATILIDNHNYARFLPACIESALGQAHPEVEVLVVDDGSTDGSAEVIRRYDGRIRAVFKENGGQASAFNAGVAHARGEWVALLDADDYFFPGKVPALAAAAHAHPDALMLYHPVQRVGASGKPFGRPLTSLALGGRLDGVARSAGGHLPFPPTSGLAVRRSALESVIPIPESDFPLCADSFLGNLVTFLGPVYRCGGPLAAYRLHGGNLWSNVRYPGVRQPGRQLDILLRQDRTMNDFLARMGQAPVDLRRSFYYRRLDWQARGGPLREVPGLCGHALRSPWFPGAAGAVAAAKVLALAALCRWNKLSSRQGEPRPGASRSGGWPVN